MTFLFSIAIIFYKSLKFNYLDSYLEVLILGRFEIFLRLSVSNIFKTVTSQPTFAVYNKPLQDPLLQFQG